MQYLDFKDIKIKEFLENVEIKRGFLDSDKLEATVSDVFIAKIIAKYPEINLNWLITGGGSMISNVPVVEYSNTSKKDKELALIPIDAMAGFGAGEFTIMEHDIIEYYKVPEFSNADFLITVKGSSMQPKYYGGDIIACKFIHSFSFFQFGVPHVITIKDRGTLVKRISKGENTNELILISDNLKYEPFTITIEDIVNIAVVIGVIRIEN
jgi:phage repressor protein C with HTH and peptisase S24 domain